MQNLINRGVTYTPGDRGGASTNQKQDIKDIKKRLFLQRAVFEICYDKTGADLLTPLRVRMFSFTSGVMLSLVTHGSSALIMIAFFDS